MEHNKNQCRAARLTHEGIIAALEADRETQPCEDGTRTIYPSASVSRAISDLNLLHGHQLALSYNAGEGNKGKPSTDIEEVSFDATNRIKRMISETAPNDSEKLELFILSVITEALVDTVTASCEQLVEENARMRAAIDQTIAWQQSVDIGNTESVRPLYEVIIQTERTCAAIDDLRAKGVEMFRDTYLSGVAKDLATSFADLLRRGGA